MCLSSTIYHLLYNTIVTIVTIVTTFASRRFFSISSILFSPARVQSQAIHRKITMETEKEKIQKVMWPQWIAAIGGNVFLIIAYCIDINISTNRLYYLILIKYINI